MPKNVNVIEVNCFLQLRDVYFCKMWVFVEALQNTYIHVCTYIQIIKTQSFIAKYKIDVS